MDRRRNDGDRERDVDSMGDIGKVLCDSQVRQCRICLQDDSDILDFQTMFQPCKCSGSILHIHQTCLKQWIQFTLNRSPASQKQTLKSQGIQCPTCHHHIKFTYIQKTKCYSSQSTKFIVVTIITFLLCVGFLAIVCSYLANLADYLSDNVFVFFFVILCYFCLVGAVGLVGYAIVGVVRVGRSVMWVRVWEVGEVEQYRRESKKKKQSSKKVIPMNNSQVAHERGDEAINYQQ